EIGGQVVVGDGRLQVCLAQHLAVDGQRLLQERPGPRILPQLAQATGQVAGDEGDIDMLLAVDPLEDGQGSLVHLLRRPVLSALTPRAASRQAVRRSADNAVTFCSTSTDHLEFVVCQWSAPCMRRRRASNSSVACSASAFWSAVCSWLICFCSSAAFLASSPC